MLRLVSLLCLFLLVQGENLDMFDPAGLQACMKKLSVGETELAKALEDKSKDPPEKIMCLFKCALEDSGFLQDGVVDKSKWPMPECVQDVVKITNCNDMVALKHCFD
ncbi:odorant binding protein 21 [Tribolium castaneum]|uniref:Odorant binding protein 21 n=1 Tax=Tribolium castaneum TaxID=7070 RepID=D6WUI5_TRICA|nr:PREDICTED: uncharacterized protein LOC103313778 [Tribolium castaneum]XP_008196160.1 PREDICTED: uncharacterized protein LOC103313778 [Tribolium castaneum]EFA09215.2 odorant binding protein 21 [Tribolium castaneum]|eukprot:XP_008196159.1 PREDICTED: uncharacterized protein LOC103313778 [Tribolium castaneum]